MATYKVYAKLHDKVPDFGGTSPLIAEGIEEEQVVLICRDVAEFGFLLGGKVGTKIWMPPGAIVQMWANPETPILAVN